MFVSGDLGSAAFAEESWHLGGFQAYSLEDFEPDWLDAPAEEEGAAEDDLASAAGEEADFFCSVEPEGEPELDEPEDELPEESPELDLGLDGAAGFLPLESFT